jgi:hypothetical protein
MTDTHNAAMQWRADIENAPMDGTRFYALWDLRDTGDGWWHGVVSYADGVWIESYMECFEPDFWLPFDALPPPPTV